MRKCISLFVIVILVFSLCACSETRTSIKDYQYIYDVVDDWNKSVMSGQERENLFGFGEYLYNSYLLLFPRDTPSTLDEFYFHWNQGVDVDGYAVYFTCKLSDGNYQNFVLGLDDFEIHTTDTTLKPLRDDEHFSFPAYILQWSNVGEKWEVLEYILLDEEHSTVVFVYTMSELALIEENSIYQVTPNTMEILDKKSYPDHTGFSIYDGFENADYDISFLEYLL